MTEFIMYIGISGSGKSTHANQYKDNYVIVSSDEYREKLYGDINDQTHNNELFSIIHKDIIDLINEDKNVIFDATNLSSKHRLSLLSKLKCRKICRIMQVPFEICIAKDKERERSVGESVIMKQIRHFSYPFDEGFDEIEVINPYSQYSFPYSYFSTYSGKDEDNHYCEPYHYETISRHCTLCKKRGIEKKEPLKFVEALALHDVGKYFTRSFFNRKGEKVERATYYDHQNVSAYIYFTSKDFNTETLFIIQNHMRAHLDGFEKWAKKQSNQDLVNDIRRFCLYDRACRIIEVNYEKV